MRKQIQPARTAVTYAMSGNELDSVVGGGSAAADIEQVLNIGSQSSGAGAGKVTFNPFSIIRK